MVTESYTETYTTTKKI